MGLFVSVLAAAATVLGHSPAGQTYVTMASVKSSPLVGIFLSINWKLSDIQQKPEKCPLVDER